MNSAMTTQTDPTIWWDGYYQAIANPQPLCYRCKKNVVGVTPPFCSTCDELFQVFIMGRYGYT